MDLPARLQPGDPVPLFKAPTLEVPIFQLASLAGRYVLLVFPGRIDEPAGAQALRQLRAAEASGLLDQHDRIGFVLGIEGQPKPPASSRGLVMALDPGFAVSRRYGVFRPPAGAEAAAYHPLALLLDPMLRVLASAPLSGLAGLLILLAGLPPPGQHMGAETTAPVLLLPRVFEPGLCRDFIAAYESTGGTESGFMVERNGRTEPVQDPSRKRRRDHLIDDQALCDALRDRVARRILPGIQRAFQFNATRVERYIVACYDGADGGHFAPHQDNTTPGTAHRRFAVTINLNDEFDGGELVLPEFGSRGYRPPAGGALVFSCSLVHAVLPVRRGRRFATLPFLYDEEGEKLRLANLERPARRQVPA